VSVRLICPWAALSAGWTYALAAPLAHDAHAFVPHKAPIVIGVYATRAACERARDEELARAQQWRHRVKHVLA
jgi:hypothetical protein